MLKRGTIVAALVAGSLLVPAQAHAEDGEDCP